MCESATIWCLMVLTITLLNFMGCDCIIKKTQTKNKLLIKSLSEFFKKEESSQVLEIF